MKVEQEEKYLVTILIRGPKRACNIRRIFSRKAGPELITAEVHVDSARSLTPLLFVSLPKNLELG